MDVGCCLCIRPPICPISKVIPCKSVSRKSALCWYMRSSTRRIFVSSRRSPYSFSLRSSGIKKWDSPVGSDMSGWDLSIYCSSVVPDRGAPTTKIGAIGLGMGLACSCCRCPVGVIEPTESLQLRKIMYTNTVPVSLIALTCYQVFDVLTKKRFYYCRKTFLQAE